MKKQLLALVFGVAFYLLPQISKSQTYSAWGKAINETNHMYDTITAAYDSLQFVFPNTAPIAWGSAKLVVYFEGNFGDWYDYLDVLDENLNYISYANQNPTGIDCLPEDSTVIQLTSTDINTWNANNSIKFTLIPNSGNGPCNFSRVRARLVYNYCLSGPPAQYASLTMANTLVCPSDGPFTLTGTPAGGTFAGTGVSGSVFNPAGLSAGSYQLSYTATDANTCTTTGYLTVKIRPTPAVNNNDTIYACNGNTIQLNATGGNAFIWYSDAALTNSIASGSSYTTSALTQTTNYWVAALDKNNSFSVTSVTSQSFGIIDHNSITGDDRGGIAVTKSFVYINGDNHIARYDLNLSPSSVMSLPMRDGIVSDLRSGKLWSLWNTTLNIAPLGVYDFDIDALRGMDSNLNFTNEYIKLSQVIDMGNNIEQAGIFAGAGIVGLYSGNTQHWYAIDVDDGNVTDVGYISTAELYGSENWSDWGVIESDCSGNYSVIYRDWNDDNIHRRVLPNGAISTVGTFTDLSDMASLTYNPWNNRWYFHYEGGSSTFGGTSETLGYAAATSSSLVCPGNGIGCPVMVTVNVPADVTFSLSSSNICLDNGAFALTSGAPAGGNYSGIGVGTNTSGTVFYPALAGIGTYTLTYTYTDNASACTDAAKSVVTVGACTGINEQSALSGISISPNPNNGNFYVTVKSEITSLQVDVLDIQGRVIYSSQQTELSSGVSRQITLDNIPAGMYFVKMTSGADQSVQRVIIAK